MTLLTYSHDRLRNTVIDQHEYIEAAKPLAIEHTIVLEVARSSLGKAQRYGPRCH